MTMGAVRPFRFPIVPSLRPAFRPAAVLAQAPAARLGQPTVRSARIIVTDLRGMPVPGADVSVRTQAGVEVSGGTANSKGVIEVSPMSGKYEIRTTFGSGGLVFSQSGEFRPGIDVFVQLPVCSPQPFLTAAEIIAMLAAGLLTAGGFYFDFQPATVTGEVLLGSSIFSIVYRLSCL